jgi:hypothetical protein
MSNNLRSGRHRHRRTPMGRLTTRGRRLVAALAAVAMVGLGVSVAAVLTRRSAIARPEDPCASPPVLVTFQGVTLQPNAMRAFRKAERLAGRDIPVVESYRSCSQQSIACQRICGDPGGCAGQCAAPGTSYHQLGAAIDVSAQTLGSDRIVQALESAGWCQSLPDSDPGHFSFDGCH